MKKCLNCKKEFEPQRGWQKFCSPMCRLALWATKKVKENKNAHAEKDLSNL